jgi:hypothetical protein
MHYAFHTIFTFQVVMYPCITEYEPCADPRSIKSISSTSRAIDENPKIKHDIGPLVKFDTRRHPPLSHWHIVNVITKFYLMNK